MEKNTNAENRNFWSIKELAYCLGVSKSLLYERVYREEIPCKRIGRRILIPDHYVKQIMAV